MIRAKIEKSKFGPWPRTAEFSVKFDTGIVNKEEEVAELALNYGVVQKHTAVSNVFGKRSWLGRAKFLDALRTEPKLVEELTAKIHEARESQIDTALAHQAETEVTETSEDWPMEGNEE